MTEPPTGASHSGKRPSLSGGELTRRGHAAGQFARDRYFWRSLTPRYFDIYDRVLTDRAS